MNTSLLQQYIDRFFGYGTFEAPIWLIGIEEGGGNKKEDIEAKMESWQKSENEGLLDVYEQHKQFPDTNLFESHNGKKIRIQPTWNKLIRLLLAFNHENISKDIVKAFQQLRLGRTNSDHCLLEIFPLASPNNKAWRYAEWFPENELLESRERYQREVGLQRLETLKHKITQYKPKVVVCYSTKMKKYWDVLIDHAATESFSMGIYAAHFVVKEGTLYVLCPHPIHMRRNEYWHVLGGEIKNRVEIL